LLADENEFAPYPMPKKEYFREISLSVLSRESCGSPGPDSGFGEDLVAIEQQILDRLKQDYALTRK
jgi:hypothetical protein